MQYYQFYTWGGINATQTFKNATAQVISATCCTI